MILHRIALRVFAVLPRPLKTLAIRTLYPTFTTGTGVCLTNDRGQVLLVTHSYSRGWGMPGGLMGRNEAPVDAAMRELQEELDLSIELVGTPIPFQSPGRRHWNMLFHATVDTGFAEDLRSHSPEVVAVAWHALDALPELAEFTSDMFELLGILPTGQTDPS